MSTTLSRVRTVVAVLAALVVWFASGLVPAAQSGAPGKTPLAEDVAGFKEFSLRVQAYVRVQQGVTARLPALATTDLPEMITAYQQALARRIREARPKAKPGDIFTNKAREAFRHASRTVLDGPRTSNSRGYMIPDGPNLGMRLAVNGIYSDTESITAPSPELLAVFPPLPVEVAYRFVGRTLILIDVKSRLIVDVAPLIRPPAR